MAYEDIHNEHFIDEMCSLLNPDPLNMMLVNNISKLTSGCADRGNERLGQLVNVHL